MLEKWKSKINGLIIFQSSVVLFATGIIGLIVHKDLSDANNSTKNVVSKKGSAEAAYVRDVTHHCKIYYTAEAHNKWDYLDHRVETKPSFKVYACDGDIHIDIEGDDEQP